MNIEELLKNGQATLVDVRTYEEFEESSLPGAVNIPLHTIPVRVDEFKLMQKPVIVFCRSGARSGQAAMWLKKNGVEVHDGGAVANMMAMVK